MSRVTIDAALLSKLANVLQTVELCDESGRVVGRFTPVIDKARHPGMEPQISEEEIERRMKIGGGRPLREILADWEKRK